MEKNKACPRKRVLRVIITCILLIQSLALTACEPLRKKFIRKKREDIKKEVVPVLEPIDYPDKGVDYSSKYKYHFSLFLVWQKDAQTLFYEKAGRKRILYMLNQMVLQMEEMQKMLPSDRAGLLEQYKQQVNRIIDRMQSPLAERNYDTFRREVERVGKSMRSNYKYSLVQEAILR